jgi:YidC/Oxa1 family membrane protein insertase
MSRIMSCKNACDVIEKIKRVLYDYLSIVNLNIRMNFEMKRLKRLFFGSLLIMLLLALSGCVKLDKSGKPSGDGWVYHFLLKPLSDILDYGVNNFHISYGVAIILVTLVIRIALLPLFINQSRSMTIQQEKKEYLKPYTESIEARMKNAKSSEDKMAANMELQNFYKANGVNLLGGLGAGCLPLIIQMPIFSALFYTTKYNEGVLASHFLGMDLAKPSVVLLVITAVISLLHGYISLIGISKEQKDQMKMMTFVSPIVTIVFGYMLSGGVQLYMAVGAVVMIVQQCIVTFLLKPKICQQVEEEFRKNSPKKPETPKEDVTISEEIKPKSKSIPVSGKGRNAGKQKKYPTNLK